MTRPDPTCIFIVEDEPAFAKAARHVLETKNFANVHTFENGEACIEKLNLQPEIILLDYNLGEDRMNGLEVLKILKKRIPDVQIIFLSAVESLEVATNTINHGAYDYVVKGETAFERVKSLLRRIVFENQIKKENLNLRRSRKIVYSIILVLLAAIAALTILQVS